MMVTPEGLVRWDSKVALKTWCSVENLNRWPVDVNTCGKIIGIKRDANVFLQMATAIVVP